MEGHWNHDICSCSGVSCGTWCVSGCICQPCQATKLHSYVLGERPPRVCSALPCLMLWLPLPVLYLVQHCIIREHVKKELNIRESGCDTCVIASCCTGSSLVQMAATLANQKGVPAFVFMDDDADLNPLLDAQEKRDAL